MIIPVADILRVDLDLITWLLLLELLELSTGSIRVSVSVGNVFKLVDLNHDRATSLWIPGPALHVVDSAAKDPVDSSRCVVNDVPRMKIVPAKGAGDWVRVGRL